MGLENEAFITLSPFPCLFFRQWSLPDGCGFSKCMSAFPLFFRTVLTAAETAAPLGVSDRTAQRYWVYAKAWLLQELQS